LAADLAHPLAGMSVVWMVVKKGAPSVARLVKYWAG
jgi:hypothetical protein